MTRSSLAQKDLVARCENSSMAHGNKYALWAAAFSDAVVITSASGEVLFWNEGASEIFGFTADETRSSNLLDLIVPSDERDHHLQTLQDGLRLGTATYESKRHRKDGTLVWVIGSVRRIDDPQDGAHLLFAKKDVTKIKTLHDAKLMDARFRDLLESMPDGIVIASPTGHIVIANSQAEALFGYEAGALRGMAVEVLLPPTLREAHIHHRSTFALQPRKRSMGSNLDLLGLRRDGTEFPVEISLAPLRTDESVFVISAIRDASERKRIERALHEKNLELAGANQAKDVLLAGMSHELRTPLNAIIGFTGTLLMKLPGPLNDEQGKQLEIVQTSARHLLSLINDLLDVAKINAEKFDLHLEPVDLGVAVSEVVATLRGQAEGKGLAFELSIPLEPFVSLIDRCAFNQILLNLIGNAINFTVSGCVTVCLERRTGPQGNLIVVATSDSGRGLSEADQEHLFTPFMRPSGRRDAMIEGSGLGLHLSQRLANVMGGSIDCVSVPGHGSTFTLTIPER
jgi:PAS domain S-box-containing protein